MADQTSIEWTDATWNPVTGCTEVSPGCDHCYAKTFAERWRGTLGHHFENGFDLTLRPERLDQPLRWKKPRRIFVNSMSDLFHKDVPDEFIARVFAVMAMAPRHSFQVLTKRHARMRSLLTSESFQAAVDQNVMWHTDAVTPWPLPNVWLGVSVEDQHWANLRIPALIRTPAAVRFLSCEPLLGPVTLWDPEPCDHTRLACEDIGCWRAIDWVIVGGESGRGARPMHPEWVRSLRDQCDVAGVPFLFKQWGEWAPAPWGVERKPGESQDAYKARAEATCATAVITNPLPDGSWALYKPDYKPWSTENADLPAEYTNGAVRRLGKKAAGRVLDGRTHDEFPTTQGAPA